jgi:tRNA(Ile)-lysidine synthase
MPSLDASIRSLWPLDLWMHSTLVVGVSGGPDSVALLHALRDLVSTKTSLVVAHIDHRLRGADSDGDREFVQSLAHRWNLPCEVVRLADQTVTPPRPSEERLRKARHRHLRAIAQSRGASWIVTGHHADDVVETLLHRLLRGSGPRGLASIAPIRAITPTLSLAHPLLSVNRAEILRYLASNGLEYRTDLSNDSDFYTRNRIRHQLLPFLREFAGSANLDQRLWSTANQIREAYELVETSARSWLASGNISDDRKTVEFASTAFFEVPWCVVREGLVQIWHACGWPLQEMTARHWDRLQRFLQANEPSTHPRRMQLPGSIDVTMRRARVRFTRNETTTHELFPT